ncbi:hypothetical protein KSP40_PGU009860 [Platanthera guangdongensis]|uniref:HMA domain-containing protein n=1 Tax=Platanthera guangdongensis TaxID=2320717 RepID=A0ABR2MPQ7_9ASPA
MCFLLSPSRLPLPHSFPIPCFDPMAADGDTSPETLKYQTSILRVSIHCQGCKNKVKKLLQGMDGVYMTTIDSQQKKVTVIGNVHADDLIKKLLKAGKHAELWQEKTAIVPNPVAGAAGGGKKSKKQGGGCGALVLDNSEKNQPGFENKPNAGNEPVITGGGDAQKKSNDDGGTEAASLPAEKLAGGESGIFSSSGGVKKKGKKKSAVNDEAAAAKPTEGKQGTASTIQILPAPAYHFPAFPTQSPAYIISYNTQPASGNAGPAAMHQSSYLYSGQHLVNGTCYIPSFASAPATYDLFSEENANACTVM